MTLKTLAIAGAVVASAVLFAGDALACSCLRPESAAQQMADAQLVFIGRVERTTPRGNDGMAVTRFAALRTLKGEHQASRTIEHHTVSATCGVTYTPDSYVIVIAGAEGGRLSTSLCQQAGFDWSDYVAAADTPQRTAATTPSHKGDCLTARA